MKNLFIIFLIFFLTFISFDSSVIALDEAALTGGWKPIPNVDDPLIVDIGKFAVDQHNKDGQAPLMFGGVLKADSQVVAGMNYNLTIKAQDMQLMSRNYVALVWDKPWMKFRKLVSFNGPF